MAHIIDSENYLEANNAMRDILFMYRDLISSYAGFGHGINRGTFDPLVFIDAGLYEEPGYTLEMDMELIHQGSAVALLCDLSDFWDEDGGRYADLAKANWGKEWRVLMMEGRLNHLPLAKEALIAGLESEDKFRALLPGIYREYVVGYFQRLLGG